MQRRLVFALTFRDYLLVPSSRVKSNSSDVLPLKMGPIGSPEMSVINQPTLCNIPEDDRIQANRSENLRSHNL